MLKEMRVEDSGNIKKQEDRYKNSLQNWQSALNENRDCLYITDDNIDTNINSS